MWLRASTKPAQKLVGNGGCQVPGDFLLVSQRDCLQITESLFSPLGEKKFDSFETEKKLNTTNAERGQVFS